MGAICAETILGFFLNIPIASVVQFIYIWRIALIIIFHSTSEIYNQNKNLQLFFLITDIKLLRSQHFQLWQPCQLLAASCFTL